MRSTVHSFRPSDDVTLGAERFGDPAAPLVLLAGGTTMRSWPGERAAAAAAILGDDPRCRPRKSRARLRPRAGHRARRPDGQPAGHAVLQAGLPTTLARAPAQLAVPTLVVHGRARGLGLDQAATAIPDAAAEEIAAAMLALETVVDHAVPLAHAHAAERDRSPFHLPPAGRTSEQAESQWVSAPDQSPTSPSRPMPDHCRQWGNNEARTRHLGQGWSQRSNQARVRRRTSSWWLRSRIEWPSLG